MSDTFDKLMNGLDDVEKYLESSPKSTGHFCNQTYKTFAQRFCPYCRACGCSWIAQLVEFFQANPSALTALEKR